MTGNANARGAPTWETIELAGERIHTSALSCGVPLVVIEKPGFARKHAAFAVEYGSFDRVVESPETGERIEVADGVAHFLEHKVFEGREGNALEAFSRRGAAVNAGTSHRFTYYYFTAAGDFAENLKLLIDFVRTPNITEEGVRKEQGIIGQEIRMYDDYPDDVRLRLLLGALFSNHPIRTHIAGTVDSIARITPELLMRCLAAFYRPENMILCAAGDLDRDAVGEAAEEAASGMPAWCAARGRLRRAAFEEPERAAAPRASRRMPVGLPKIVLGFKEVVRPQRGAALLEREMGSDFLVDIVFGRASETFRSLYDAGLIDESFFAFAGTYPDIGFIAVGGDTPLPRDLVERLRAAAHEAEAMVTDREVERVKRKYLGEFVRRFNTVEYLGTACISYYLSGIGLADVWEAIQAVTASSVRARARELFHDERSAVASVVPLAWEGEEP